MQARCVPFLVSFKTGLDPVIETSIKKEREDREVGRDAQHVLLSVVYRELPNGEIASS